jgi:hypothetical protein
MEEAQPSAQWFGFSKREINLEEKTFEAKQKDEMIK